MKLKHHSFSRIFIIMVVFVTVLSSSISSCKKLKKGVLELKKHYNTTSTSSFFDDTYKAYVITDELYDADQEFTFDSDNISETTGYYWSDKSVFGLGYNHQCGDHFTSSNSCDATTPGKNGHWGSSSGQSNSCLEGVWYSPACGNSQGVIWTFNADKTGSTSNQDCNGICSPMVFTFTWDVTGSTCSITYDAVQPYVNCTGYPPTRPNKPTDDSFTFTCSGTSLSVTSGSGSTTFTK